MLGGREGAERGIRQQPVAQVHQARDPDLRIARVTRTSPPARLPVVPEVGVAVLDAEVAPVDAVQRQPVVVVTTGRVAPSVRNLVEQPLHRLRAEAVPGLRDRTRIEALDSLSNETQVLDYVSDRPVREQGHPHDEPCDLLRGKLPATDRGLPRRSQGLLDPLWVKGGLETGDALGTLLGECIQDLGHRRHELAEIMIDPRRSGNPLELLVFFRSSRTRSDSGTRSITYGYLTSIGTSAARSRAP